MKDNRGVLPEGGLEGANKRRMGDRKVFMVGDLEGSARDPMGNENLSGVSILISKAGCRK